MVVLAKPPQQHNTTHDSTAACLVKAKTTQQYNQTNKYLHMVIRIYSRRLGLGLGLRLWLVCCLRFSGGRGWSGGAFGSGSSGGRGSGCGSGGGGGLRGSGSRCCRRF